jgi:hypothetical protein
MTEWISAFSIFTLLAVAGFAAAASSGHEDGSVRDKKRMNDRDADQSLCRKSLHGTPPAALVASRVDVGHAG